MGLHEPRKAPNRFLALEVIERKGRKTRGRMLREEAAAQAIPKCGGRAPPEPPKLKPEAARILLRILLGAAKDPGVVIRWEFVSATASNADATLDVRKHILLAMVSAEGFEPSWAYRPLGPQCSAIVRGRQ